jgi:predicted ATPase/class 3 adenylate cyclase
MTTSHNWPTGVVTYLFTDIENSTLLWDRHRSAMRPALAEHDALLKTAVESNDGVVVKTTGDGLMAAFFSPASALTAALEAQQVLQQATWSAIDPDRIRVRMGLHAGEAELRAGDYYGTAVNRAARLMSIGHGGQILLSGTTTRFLQSNLPDDVKLIELGEYSLKGLARPTQVFQVLAPFLAHDFPPLHTGEAAKNNLPQPLTTFIGREMELKEIDVLIADSDTRLVTILGPGGMGKTRLALAYLDRHLTADSPFPDGVFFINFAPLSQADQIPSTMANALNFPLGGGDARSPQQQIFDYLRHKKMLLLFDNFEHLLDGVESVVDLLETARDVKILVTSRERLHVRLEQLYPIKGLQFPDWETPEDAERYTAVQLFLQSARRNQPDFALQDGDDLTYLARICRLVAGMPLALELAASWVDMLPLAEIAVELQQGLDFLEADMRDLPDRHRSMRAAIDYSWWHLTEEEQEIFARLSVFRGGFTREAARAVAGNNLRQMGRLMNKSFLQYDQIHDRYQVHELMRQYGAEKLADAERVQTQHLNFFVNFAEDVSDGLSGPEPNSWVKRLLADIDNLRAALDWAAESRHAQAGLQMAAALHGYWIAFSDWSEARQRIAQLLAPPEAARHTLARAYALHVVGNLACHMGDYEAGFAFLEESKRIGLELGDAGKVCVGWALLAFGEFLHDKSAARESLEDGIAILREAGEPWQLWLGYNTRAWMAVESGDYSQAHAFFSEALAFARKKGFRWLSGITMAGLGDLLYLQGDFGAAQTCLEESEVLLRSLNDLKHRSLSTQGAIALLQGDYHQAVAYFEELLANYRQQGNELYFTRAMSDLGIASGYLGNHAQAAALLSEALALTRETSSLYDKAVCLLGIAGIQPQPRRAVQLLAAAQAAFEASGAIMIEPIYIAESTRIEEAARTALGETVFATAYAEGKSMAAEKAIARALMDSHEWADGSLSPFAPIYGTLV